MTLGVDAADTTRFLEDIGVLATSRGLQISEIRSGSVTLEDVFKRLTGHRGDDANDAGAGGASESPAAHENEPVESGGQG